MGFPGLLGRGLGETGDLRVPSEDSARGLRAAAGRPWGRCSGRGAGSVAPASDPAAPSSPAPLVEVEGIGPSLVQEAFHVAAKPLQSVQLPLDDAVHRLDVAIGGRAARGIEAVLPAAPLHLLHQPREGRHAPPPTRPAEQQSVGGVVHPAEGQPDHPLRHNPSAELIPQQPARDQLPVARQVAEVLESICSRPQGRQLIFSAAKLPPPPAASCVSRSGRSAASSPQDAQNRENELFPERKCEKYWTLPCCRGEETLACFIVPK